MKALNMLGAYVKLVFETIIFVIIQLFFVYCSGGFFAAMIIEHTFYPAQVTFTALSFIASFIWPMCYKERLFVRIQHARSFGKKNPIATSSNCSVQ